MANAIRAFVFRHSPPRQQRGEPALCKVVGTLRVPYVKRFFNGRIPYPENPRNPVNPGSDK